MIPLWWVTLRARDLPVPLTDLAARSCRHAGCRRAPSTCWPPSGRAPSSCSSWSPTPTACRTHCSPRHPSGYRTIGKEGVGTKLWVKNCFMYEYHNWYMIQPVTDWKRLDLPINTGDINHQVYHITAQFVRLHVHWWAVCGDIYLTDNVEEKCLLYAGVL